MKKIIFYATFVPLGLVGLALRIAASVSCAVFWKYDAVCYRFSSWCGWDAKTGRMP